MVVVCCRDVAYAACSKEVDAVMGHDVMKSVANLVRGQLFSYTVYYF